jgi:hypothetical protein
MTGPSDDSTIPPRTHASVATPPRSRSELEEYVATRFHLMFPKAIAKLEEAAAARDRRARALLEVASKWSWWLRAQGRPVPTALEAR